MLTRLGHPTVADANCNVLQGVEGIYFKTINNYVTEPHVFEYLDILDKKIQLARKDEKVYKNLYRLTKDLAHAGEKTSLDADVMYNSLQIRKLDQQIFEIDKQIKLLMLYVRVENAI